MSKKSILYLYLGILMICLATIFWMVKVRSNHVQIILPELEEKQLFNSDQYKFDDSRDLKLSVPKGPQSKN